MIVTENRDILWTEFTLVHMITFSDDQRDRSGQVIQESIAALVDKSF